MASPTAPSEPSRPHRWWLAAAAAVVAALLLPVPALGTHVQTAPAGSASVSVQFDHDGDNSWWVEVLTNPGPGDFVAALDARAESGDWKPMKNMGTIGEWTKWGPSQAFQIPSGQRVQFRAHMVDSATGSTAVVISCFFTHPAGAEQCAAPPPPPPPPPPGSWHATHMGSAGIASGSGDLAVSDADSDSIPDVTSATRNGIYTFEWTGSAWTSQRVGTSGGFGALAVGDGNNDGLAEIYAMRNGELMRYTWTGSAWLEASLWTFAEPFAADMTFGDADGLPGREIYVATYDGEFAVINKVRLGPSGELLERSRIAMMAGDVHSIWSGDGDGDRRAELYIGHSAGSTAMVSRLGIGTSGGWELTLLDVFEGDQVWAVAGDGDRDGRPEVYGMVDDGTLREMEYFAATGWRVGPVFQMPPGTAPDSAPSGLFLGDGDGDGTAELYVPTHHGQAFQVRWAVSEWAATEIARPRDADGRTGDAALAIAGDGDGDGIREAYLSVSFGSSMPGDDGHTEMYRLSPVQPVLFDATFTGVRGNEWWIQANVAASGGTLATVDVRLDGGEWKPLTKHSWGGWAASYRAVQGTIVQFRATSTTGATDLSDCYRWIPPSNTDATKVACGSPPPPPPPPPGFDATFGNVKGNAWWVQAQVSPNGGHTIAKVDVRLNDGAWQPLAKQSWGPNDYAASYHMPEGTKVQFRATSGAGATDLSGCYRWVPPSGGLAPSMAC